MTKKNNIRKQTVWNQFGWGFFCEKTLQQMFLTILSISFIMITYR